MSYKILIINPGSTSTKIGVLRRHSDIQQRSLQASI